MDFGLDESLERAALRQAVADLGRSYGHRYYASCVAESRFPRELWAELARAGYAGVNVSLEHNGGGGGLGDLAVVVEELAAAGCPLMTLVVSPGVCAPILKRYGSLEQRKRWLTGIGAGAARMAFALTEASAGSNTHALTTRADGCEGGWVITGEKHYISGVSDSETIMLVARTGIDETTGRGLLSIFVVDASMPGLTVRPIATHVLAVEGQYLLSFDGAYVGADRLIGTEGEGFAQLFDGLNPERVLSAATCLGIARHALGKAVDYASSREVWGRPIAAHQGVAHPLARAYASICSSRLLLYDAALRYDTARSSAAASSVAKYQAAQTVDLALDVSIQVHGGHGLSAEYGLADLWGLARLYRIAPVSDEMTLNHIATHALGLPKSY